MYTFFTDSFSGRLYQTLLSILALAGLTYIFIQSSSIILLLIFAVVLAVGLTSLSHGLQKATRTPYPLALFTVVVFLFGLTALFFSYFIPAVAQELSQADKLISQVNDSLEDISTRIINNEGLASSLNTEQILQTVQDRGGSILTGVQSIFTSTFAVLFNVLLMLVITIYLALNPKQYSQGLVHIFAEKNQAKVSTLLSTANHSLQWWLLARLSSMVVVGVLTYIGLLILGVPLAFSLAVLTGLLSFIPNLGPVLSFLPAGLVALTLGGGAVVSVIILYIVVQIIESNAITPIIEKRMVSTPPALLLASQVILGTVFGFIGLLLAAPIVAVGIGLWAEHAKQTAEGDSN